MAKEAFLPSLFVSVVAGVLAEGNQHARSRVDMMMYWLKIVLIFGMQIVVIVLCIIRIRHALTTGECRYETRSLRDFSLNVNTISRDRTPGRFWIGCSLYVLCGLLVSFSVYRLIQKLLSG